jgi:hypothetical protein
VHPLREGPAEMGAVVEPAGEGDFGNRTMRSVRIGKELRRPWSYDFWCTYVTPSSTRVYK